MEADQGLDEEYGATVDAIRLLPDPDDCGDGTWSGWSKEIDRLEAKAGMIREEIARAKRCGCLRKEAK